MGWRITIIDYRDARTLQWLKDVIAEKVTIDFKYVELERVDYPRKI